MTTSEFDRAARFFYDNAGYSVPTGAEARDEEFRQGNARELAVAEQTAKARGWAVQWALDDAQDEPGDLMAILDDGEGETLAVLGSIGADSDDDYRRVIEAELALEAIGAGNAD